MSLSQHSLLAAATFGQLTMVEELVARGADIEAKNRVSDVIVAMALRYVVHSKI